MLFYNLLALDHPFWSGYVGGSWLLRVVTWGVTGLFALSVVAWSMRKLAPQRRTRVDFYRDAASSQLDDWELDQHWLPFDNVVEICAAPNLLEPHGGDGQAGWDPTDCRLRDIGEFYAAPRLEESYTSWRRGIDPKKLEKDGTKYVLVNHPTSETDEHFVDMELRRTRWSRIQACLSTIKQATAESDAVECRKALFQAADPAWTPGGKPRMNLMQSILPHSLCLHGVVVTKDRKILALQRPGPKRTDYHPYTWSFSFEEQLAEDDFDGNTDFDVSRWLIRGVRQEVLGAEVSTLFDVTKSRLLTIAIEEELFNPFVVAFIPVECESTRLVEILPSASDRAEWLRYAFYSVDPPFDLLADAFRTGMHTDGHLLHPTSRYRIYLALSTLLPPAFDVHEILQRS